VAASASEWIWSQPSALSDKQDTTCSGEAFLMPLAGAHSYQSFRRALPTAALDAELRDGEPDYGFEPLDLGGSSSCCP